MSILKKKKSKVQAENQGKDQADPAPKRERKPRSENNDYQNHPKFDKFKKRGES